MRARERIGEQWKAQSRRENNRDKMKIRGE